VSADLLEVETKFARFLFPNSAGDWEGRVSDDPRLMACDL